MSDSLLNLLEILDEVVAEQESVNMWGQTKAGKLKREEFYQQRFDILTAAINNESGEETPPDSLIGNGEQQVFEILSKSCYKYLYYFLNRNKESNQSIVLKKAALAKVDSLIISLRSKNLKAAIGIINHQINGSSRTPPELAESARKSVLQLSSLFNKINMNNLGDNKKQKISHKIVDSMVSCFNINQFDVENKQFKLIYPISVADYIISESDWVTGIAAQTGKAKLSEFAALLGSLSKGTGWLRGSQTAQGAARRAAAQGKVAAKIATSKSALDPRDILQFVKQAKSGDFSYLESFLLATNSFQEGSYYQKKYIELLRTALSQIFEHYINDENLFLRNRRQVLEAIFQIVDVRERSMGKNKQYKKGEPYYPHFIDLGMEIHANLKGSLGDKYDDYIKDVRSSLGTSVSSPSIKTSGGTLSKGFSDTLDIFFGDATGFAERLKIFNKKMSVFALPRRKFQKLVQTPPLPYSIYGASGDEKRRQEELGHIDTLDLMNRIFMMDYFVEFSKGFSAPIAGLMFEYFLAGLVGGKVVGQRGDVVDFQVGDSLGSAKFISSLKNAVQSVQSFQVEEAMGKKVTYVVGLKKASEFKIEDAAVAPLEIQEVDIYTFDIIHKGELVFSVDGGEDEDLNDSERENKNLLYSNPGKIYLTNIMKNKPPVVTLKIMSTDTNGIKTYRQTLDALLDDSEDKVIQMKRKILNKVEEIFDNIKGGESDARNYAQTGDKQKGQSAMKQLYDSREAISSLSGISAIYDKLPEPNDT